MPVIAAARLAAAAALLLVLLPGCKGPEPQKCQRYDAVSLVRENGFSARVDWPGERTVDLSMERVEIALTAIRPLRGPVELVHVIGDTEADHWLLVIPDFVGSPTSLCWIAPNGGYSTCGATLQNAPLSPGGYYYLKAGDNTVLEAGISFFICD